MARHYEPRAGLPSARGKGKAVEVNTDFMEKIVNENKGGPKAQFKAFEEAKKLVGDVKAFEALANYLVLMDAMAGIGGSDKRAEAAVRIVLTTIGGMTDTEARKLAVEAGYDFGPANREHVREIYK